MGQVCWWTEKARIKSLETVGVVRDNAVTGEVKSDQNHLYGNATNQELVGLWNVDYTPTFSPQKYQGYLPNSENGSTMSWQRMGIVRPLSDSRAPS